VEVRRFDDPASFQRAVEPLLMRDEARHNLLLGILATLRGQPDEYPDHFMWLLEEDGQVVGAAARTPPHNMVVAQPLDHRALPVLARSLLDEGIELPGVTGARPEVDEFASVWTAVSERPPRLRMAQGIYRLTSVLPVTGVTGRMRSAERADRDLLIEWVAAFQGEALPEDTAADWGQWVDRRLGPGLGGLFLWGDPEPVSLAGYGGATPNGARVGPVYTPPKHRGRGYASALVAEMSAWILAEGNRFCFLYTDLANPTSNRIYRRIGYELVCESAELAFD
jgi:predicted GNAT family acetyltransferase